MSFSIRILLIIAAISAIAAIAFALQNAEVATVSFLFWSFEGSLALVLLFTFLLGVISGALFAFSRSRSSKKDDFVDSASQKTNIE